MQRPTTKASATAAVKRRGKKPAPAPKRSTPARKPRSLEDEISTLAATGQLAEAARSAIRAQQAAGLPITYQEGNEIIKEFPDGRREVLATLQPSTYRRPK